MIFAVSGRTDIPAYYGEWFMNRIHDGYVLVRNPYYPDNVSRYDLTPEIVDCFWFISKNYKPFLQYVPELLEKYACMFDYTITPYGVDVEPYVPSAMESIETFKKLSEIVGLKRIGLRYDPIFSYGVYDMDYHKRCFDYMLGELEGYTEIVYFSYVNMYKKVIVNFPGVVPFTEDQKDEFFNYMLGKCYEHGMKIRCCPGVVDARDFELEHGVSIDNVLDLAGCMTFENIEAGNPSVKFKNVKARNMKFGPGCTCAQNKDIGAYNTCFHGCKYCFANESTDVAFRRDSEMYNMESKMLYDVLVGDEIIHHAKQQVFKVTS